MNSFNKLSYEEINLRLNAHALWLSSGGREGGCADFSGCRIDGFNFRERSLCGFSTEEIKALWQASPLILPYPNARIDGADFSRSWLENCDFGAANCTRCNFSHARISRCHFKKANLEDANFDGVVVNDCEWDDEFVHQFEGNNSRRTLDNESSDGTGGLEIDRLKAALAKLESDNLQSQTNVAKLKKELDDSKEETEETQKQLQGMIEDHQKGETYYSSAYAALLAAKNEAAEQLKQLTKRRDWLDNQAKKAAAIAGVFVVCFVVALIVLASYVLRTNAILNNLSFLNSLIRYGAGATVFVSTCTLALFALVGRTQKQMLTFSRSVMMYDTYKSMLHFSMVMDPRKDQVTRELVEYAFGCKPDSFMARTFQEICTSSLAHFNSDGKEESEVDVLSGILESLRIITRKDKEKE
ncbi:MAG: pentapeptide repeat-containing protein [Gallionella sp.]